MCCEPVHTDAKRCPSCGHWLLARRRLISGAIVLAALACLAYVFVGIMLDIPSPFPRKVAPTEVTKQLTVVDSSIRFVAQGDCVFVSTVGTLRNESTDVAVEDIYVQVRYLDGDGELIDAQGAKQYGLVLLPGAEVAFSVRGRASSEQSEYASHRATVVSAEQARF
jgi:hypothetical protein